MYNLPLGSIYEFVRFLNPFGLLTALACVAVHILACSYHHHSFTAFFRSFIVLALCVYFLRIVLSDLSPLVCLFLIGPRQRDICSAVLVLRYLQITEYFVPDFNCARLQSSTFSFAKKTRASSFYVERRILVDDLSATCQGILLPLPAIVTLSTIDTRVPATATSPSNQPAVVGRWCCTRQEIVCHQ